jgi:hypothetical protein
VKNARYAWKEENYEDDEKEMGALCFTQSVRRTRVPKGFKLPHDQQKYDGRKNLNCCCQTTFKQYKYSKEHVVTQHTIACCSMQVVDITFMRYHFTNITSLRVVQQKHSGLYSSTKYYKP